MRYHFSKTSLRKSWQNSNSKISEIKSIDRSNLLMPFLSNLTYHRWIFCLIEYLWAQLLQVLSDKLQASFELGVASVHGIHWLLLLWTTCTLLNNLAPLRIDNLRSLLFAQTHCEQLSLLQWVLEGCYKNKLVKLGRWGHESRRIRMAMGIQGLQKKSWLRDTYAS
jgi:hypothetical protein